MKDIKEMTQDELSNYFINIKLKGASYREIVNIFDKNEIDKETRKSIIAKLDVIDKKQKEEIKKEEKSNKKGGGIVAILIGIGIVIFGFVLYARTSQSGVIFIFNFVVWGFGGILIFKGILNVIAGYIKK